MKKILTILSAAGVLTLPFAASAITIRTDHRNSTGGITVSEGSAAATGDESSSVSVSNIISGTRGQVQVTTVRDGVTTTETHDINGGSSVVVTPTPPQNNDNGGRTPRSDRGSVAVQAGTVVSVSDDAPKSVSVQTTARSSSGNSKPTSKSSIKGTKSSLRLAVANVGSSHTELTSPHIVSKITVRDSQEAGDIADTFSTFISKIFSLFGLAA
jgi:hypothetical protein